MFKQKLILECKGKEDKLFVLECHPQSTLGEVNAVLEAMKNYVEKKIEQIDTPVEEKKCEEKACQEQE